MIRKSNKDGLGDMSIGIQDRKSRDSNPLELVTVTDFFARKRKLPFFKNTFGCGILGIRFAEGKFPPSLHPTPTYVHSIASLGAAADPPS